jgi:hypothetical protein
MIITLENHEKEEYFHNALCNEQGMLASSGIEIVHSKEDYDAAKAKLTSPCYEDVLMQILKDGNKLQMIDLEDDDNVLAEITLQDMYDNFQYVSQEVIISYVEESDDACTADVLLQYVFLKELVYG